MSNEVSHGRCIDVHGHVSTESPACYHVLKDSQTVTDNENDNDNNNENDTLILSLNDDRNE